MNIDAIAVDIDGTITDNKRRLCYSAMESIRKAEDAGVPTIIVTGNIVTYAYATLVLLGASGGVVSENGGVIFKENYNNNQIKTIVDRTYVTAADEHLKETLGPKFDKHISNDNMYRLTESVFYKTITKKELEEGLEGFKYLDKIELYDSGFALHVTDKRVNKVTRVLFKKYDSLEKLKNADLKDLKDIVRELGSYNKKAVYVKEIARIIVDDYNGIMPRKRKELEVMPGVGRKTINVLFSELDIEPNIAVDTHVERVSKRLGLAKKDDNVYEIEMKLRRKFKRENWNKRHKQLVLFGRYYCKAIKPECDTCGIKDICKEKNKRI